MIEVINWGTELRGKCSVLANLVCLMGEVTCGKVLLDTGDEAL